MSSTPKKGVLELVFGPEGAVGANRSFFGAPFLSTQTGHFLEAHLSGKRRKTGKFWPNISLKYSYKSKTPLKIANWSSFCKTGKTGKTGKKPGKSGQIIIYISHDKSSMA